MGYGLEAVIGGEELLRGVARGLPAARVAVLGQGLALVPVTDEFFDAVTDGSAMDPLGFRRLPGGFGGVLAGWSVAGPVAYVEAEFFGGRGGQQAAVWGRGALVLGPLGMREDEAFPADGTPISRALRRMGVRVGAAVDEFAAVGLGRHRWTEDWIR